MNPTPTSIHSTTPRRAAAPSFALLAAIAIASLLAFTSYAKAFHPNPKPVHVEWFDTDLSGLAIDRALAGIEVAFAVMLLGLHRQRGMWLVTALFFAALAGYSLFKSWHGESCGCFAALWDPPPYSTFALDLVISTASFALASALRAPRALVAASIAGALLFAGVGWAVSDATTPPRKIDQPAGTPLPHTRLLQSEPMKDIREQPEGGPGWLICAFDPTCHICEDMKPLIEFKRDELAETADPFLQVRIFQIPDMEKTLGIEQWTWETPTIFVVQDAKITKLWSGTELENYAPERFQEIYTTLSAGGYPPEDAPPTHLQPKP